jgi:hypothetical protein
VTANARVFGYGEHLLIRAWRRVAGGRVARPAMTQTSQDGAEGFLTFSSFLQALGRARRRLATGGPAVCERPRAVA